MNIELKAIEDYVASLNPAQIKELDVMLVRSGAMGDVTASGKFMFYDNEADEWGPLTEKQYAQLKAQAAAYGRLRIAIRNIHEQFMQEISSDLPASAGAGSGLRNHATNINAANASASYNKG